MTHAISTTKTKDNTGAFKAIHWFLAAALAGAFGIVFHEFLHYITALLLGAADVSFHWGYVHHDSHSVSNGSNAAIAIIGPISTYVMMAVAWWYSRNAATPFFSALGFTAAFRNLAVLPFLIKTMLGADTATFFFDEIRAANALGVSPIGFALISLSMFFLGTVYFSRQTKQTHSWVLMLIMIAGTFAGIYAWSIFGAMLFPGGHGFN